VPAGFHHLIADLSGVSAARLRDGPLLSGLCIAAASAAGLSPVAAPVVRSLPQEGVTGFVPMDGCHMLFHTFPDRELLLLDVLTPPANDGRKALEVFARRLHPREVWSEVHERGEAGQEHGAASEPR
jgi:S-adenosylmethionine/arginine decarboxylase-like enzyme